MEQVVYDTLGSGGYLIDGPVGLALTGLAVVGALAGLALLVAGVVGRSIRRVRITAGIVLLLAGVGGLAGLESAPLKDRRSLADGRYNVFQGTVFAVSDAYVSVDKTRFAVRCGRGAACPLPATGDRVRVAYRLDDDTIEGVRALRIWREPAPAADMQDDQPDDTTTYVPAGAARPTVSSPTTRSSGGLTIRLIPGTLGQ